MKRLAVAGVIAGAGLFGLFTTPHAGAAGFPHAGLELPELVEAIQCRDDGGAAAVSGVGEKSRGEDVEKAVHARGYGRVMLVSPANHNSPDAPMPGRSAA